MHTIEDIAPARTDSDPRSGAPARGWRTAWSLPEVRWAALATALFAAGVVAQLAGAPAWAWWGLYLACYAAGGWEPTLEGLRALREKSLDVDILMIVAALAAAAIGHVFDGALLIVIFASSGAMEAFVTRRTADSVSALLTLAPTTAHREDGSGDLHEVEVADLVVGDLVLVRAGELVPADGVVLEGASDVDQASITGEPMPVAKQTGDQVYAGTLNGFGALRVQVRAGAEESVVARIVSLVEEASETKAGTQLFIERVEEKYSVVVVVATLLILGVPLALGAPFEETLLRAMTFMVVASPCALVLATMPPLLAVIANAGRHGVLVKSAVALQALREVDTVVFDKTGTLTHGEPVVVEVVPAATDARAVLSLAASVERGSDHPIARAVLAHAAAAGIVPGAASDFVTSPGRGVQAQVDGALVELLAPRWCTVPDGPLAQCVADAERAGRTAVVLLRAGQAGGVLVLEDRVRDSAATAVADLERVVGATELLSGDGQGAVDAVAARVGVGTAQGGLLPEAKAERVVALRTQGRSVMFVGDGVNDAPAMASAHVGVAMARTGSDLAVETADVILVRDDLDALRPAVELARRAHRVMVANLVIAAAVIVVLVAWDLFGTLPLALGVAGHEGSTVLVALNGMRLLRRGAWRG